ncbi:MAG: hypothetical protein JKY54_00725 [Flavobacteriales bacterium]|nr:hypothetical protein [Flavobacteriales bacterium]
MMNTKQDYPALCNDITEMARENGYLGKTPVILVNGLIKSHDNVDFYRFMDKLKIDAMDVLKPLSISQLALLRSMQTNKPPENLNTKHGSEFSELSASTHKDLQYLVDLGLVKRINKPKSFVTYKLSVRGKKAPVYSAFIGRTSPLLQTST